MATYKVIQDIEAEDKLVGPLSFRQFVYFLIAAFLGYINFIAIAKGAAFLSIILGPPMLFCLFFAWPWTPDQPTEVWAIARLRFLVKSRKRVWDQSGIKEFVTVTVPKRIERNYTDGLSQNEVRSRLQALAHTIDSRGWAVKNAYAGGMVVSADSDRLLDFDSMPQEVSNLDIRAGDDILDELNNPAASQMSAMIDASSKARRQDLMERLRAQGASLPQPANNVPQWFKRAQPTQATDVAATAMAGTLPQVAPVGSAAPSDEITLPKAKPSANTHLKSVSPAGQPVESVQTPQAAAEPVVNQPISTPADPAILSLSQDNNRDIASLAREAKKVRELDDSDEEVTVSLR